MFNSVVKQNYCFGEGCSMDSWKIRENTRATKKLECEMVTEQWGPHIPSRQSQPPGFYCQLCERQTPLPLLL